MAFDLNNTYMFTVGLTRTFYIDIVDSFFIYLHNFVKLSREKTNILQNHAIWCVDDDMESSKC